MFDTLPVPVCGVSLLCSNNKIIFVFPHSVRTNSAMAGLLHVIRDNFFPITLN